MRTMTIIFVRTHGQWRNQEFKLGGAQLLGARSTPPLVSSALHFTPSSCIICSPTALAMTFLPSTHLKAGGLGSSPGIFYIFLNLKRVVRGFSPGIFLNFYIAVGEF